jgi:hypothetical protein
MPRRGLPSEPNRIRSWYFQENFRIMIGARHRSCNDAEISTSALGIVEQGRHVVHVVIEHRNVGVHKPCLWMPGVHVLAGFLDDIGSRVPRLVIFPSGVLRQRPASYRSFSGPIGRKRPDESLV